MSFFLFLLQSMTILTMRVEWVYDYIVVPVFSNIEDYRYLPEAKLYIDDFLVEDASVSYDRNGVEWTYISTVNTSNLRRYSIKYRAYFPRYNLYHVQTIVFDVIDLDPPEIIKFYDQNMMIGDKLPDLTSSVVATDNYDEGDVISITCDTSKVVLYQVGNYDITYIATDTSGNQAYQHATLRIIDPLPPEIMINKPLILNANEDFVWQNFLTVKDNVDAFLTVLVDDDDVDYHTLGSYELRIDVIDQSGNVLHNSLILEIADLESPLLWLTSKPTDILVNSEINDALLYGYIVSLSDNIDTLSLSDVRIVHDIEPSVLGTYQVTYEVSDQSQNMTSQTIEVKVVDDVKPTIEIVEPFVFEVFSKEPLWLNHIQLSDNYDDQDDLVFKITESINMHVVGSYLITIEVTDTSRNKAIYQGYADVVDLIPPVITQLNDAIITDFEKKDFTHYFSYQDQYDEATYIVTSIDDSTVDYEHIGSYEAIVYATDTSDNIAQLSFEVMVIDITLPELTLKSNTHIMNIGDAQIDLRSLIAYASDNYDTCGIDDVIISSDILWDHFGKYEVIFSLSDQSFNTTEQIFYLTIDDRIPPSLSIDDIEIKQYEHFDPLAGVVATDNVEISNIEFYPEKIDTSSIGSFIITYIAYDTRGNYTQVDRQVTVLPNDTNNTWIDYIPIGIILVLGGAILIILYRKR